MDGARDRPPLPLCRRRRTGRPARAVRDGAERALAALVTATGLRGLVSADLLVEGDAWWLLEVNPRPGATLDVLDRAAQPLFSAHLAAADGRLPEHRSIRPGAAATEILYAGTEIPSVPVLDWPDWAMDRPPAGSRVEAGAPICTVLAEGADAGAARQAVARRAADLRARLRATADALAFAGRRPIFDAAPCNPLSRGEEIPHPSIVSDNPACTGHEA